MKEIVAYLSFDGNCREAMTFYQKCLGAELQLSPFSDAPGTPAEAKDRILHARLTKGTAVLMASDTMPGMPFQAGTNFSISIHCDSAEEVDKLVAAFSEKGTVSMPVADTFWGARFGMLKDQFGLHWMFNFEYPKK